MGLLVARVVSAPLRRTAGMVRALAPGRPLVLKLGTQDRWAVLQVLDGGPGLAPEDYPVAFERGVLHERYRGRRPGGAGLGLALAHGLVGPLGGTIAAAPAPRAVWR